MILDFSATIISRLTILIFVLAHKISVLILDESMGSVAKRIDAIKNCALDFIRFVGIQLHFLSIDWPNTSIDQ